MDILSDVLENVRLTGSVFYFADFHEPWCIVAPPSCDYAPMLVAGARELVIFHIVVDGRCVVGPVDGEPVELSAGDAILLPRGDAHIMGDQSGREPTPVTELLPMPPWEQPPSLSFGGQGESARLLCGYLHCADASLSPFLETLPRVLKVAGSGPLGSSLATVRRLLVDQALDERPGSASVLARLTETFFIEALRRQISAQDEEVQALAALGDPVVGRALNLIHGDPARAWTVDLLAREVACRDRCSRRAFPR